MRAILLILIVFPFSVFSNTPLGFGYVVTQNIRPDVLTYIKQASQNNYRNSKFNNKAIHILKRGWKVQSNKFHKTKSTKLAYKESEKFFVIKPVTNIKSIFTDTLEQIYYLIDEDVGYFQVISIDTSKTSGIKFISGNISNPYYKSFKEFSEETDIKFEKIEFPGVVTKLNYNNSELDTLKIHLWLILQANSLSRPWGLVLSSNFTKDFSLKSTSFSPIGYRCVGQKYPNDYMYDNFPRVPNTRGDFRIQFGIKNKFLVSKKIECVAKNNELIMQLNIDAFSFIKTIEVEPPRNNQIIDDRPSFWYLKFHDSTVVSVIDSVFNNVININNSTIKSRETIIYRSGTPIEDTLYTIKKFVNPYTPPSETNNHLIYYWSYCEYYCPYVILQSEINSYTYRITYNRRNNKTYVKIIKTCRKEGFTKEIINIK
jgi:hypothetical protein